MISANKCPKYISTYSLNTRLTQNRVFNRFLVVKALDSKHFQVGDGSSMGPSLVTVKLSEGSMTPLLTGQGLERRLPKPIKRGYFKFQ